FARASAPPNQRRTSSASAFASSPFGRAASRLASPSGVRGAVFLAPSSFGSSDFRSWASPAPAAQAPTRSAAPNVPQPPPHPPPTPAPPPPPPPPHPAPPPPLAPPPPRLRPPLPPATTPGARGAARPPAACCNRQAPGNATGSPPGRPGGSPVFRDRPRDSPLN